MLYPQTKVKITDSSGEYIGLCLEYKKNIYYRIGNLVKCSIVSGKSQGSIILGLIVRTKKQHILTQGIYIKYQDNAIILVHKTGNQIVPIAKRIQGPISRLILKGTWKHILQLSQFWF